MQADVVRGCSEGTGWCRGLSSSLPNAQEFHGYLTFLVNSDAPEAWNSSSASSFPTSVEHSSNCSYDVALISALSTASPQCTSLGLCTTETPELSSGRIRLQGDVSLRAQEFLACSAPVRTALEEFHGEYALRPIKFPRTP